MNSFARAHVRALAAVTLVAACAWNRETVVLLPADDGAAVTVTKGNREVVLDRPYAATRQSWYAGSESYTSSADDVQASFGQALAAQPRRPKSFTLNFVQGSEEFDVNTKDRLDAVLAEIAAYPVPDIVVVGHTDATGNDELNDPLSLRRANTVRAALIERGVAPESIVAYGRGKRELLRPTSGADPANRRVEIIVR